MTGDPVILGLKFLLIISWTIGIQSDYDSQYRMDENYSRETVTLAPAFLRMEDCQAASAWFIPANVLSVALL